MTKSQFLDLIGRDDLEQLIAALLAYARQYHLADLQSDAIIQSGQLEGVKKALRAGATPYEELALQRAAVRQNLLDLINNLPDAPPKPPASGRKPGISERFFKNSLFWMMVLGKLAIVAWLSFEVDSGGFSPREFSTTISMLVPIFTAYLAPMVAEYIKNRHVTMMPTSAVEKRLSWTLPLLTWLIILPLYFGFMFSTIQLRGNGIFSFEQMTGRLMLLESFFGVYLGMIVNSVFEKKET